MTDEIRKKLQTIDLTEQFSRLIKYRIPTGIIAIDRVTGGGIPSGKITEVYGGWSAGKTRLALHIIVETLKLGGYAVLIDEERALEVGLCDLVGLDIKNKKFFYGNPDKIETIEHVVTFIEKVIGVIREVDSKAFLCIVWDSLASTPTKDDLKELNPQKDEDIGTQANIAAARRAKLVGRGVRRLSSKLFKTHSCLVIVNQIQDRFDVMFGDKTTTPGGKAVKFHASLRMKLKLIKKITDKQTLEQVGNKVQLVVEKSRIAAPFGMVQFEMNVYEPIDPYAGLLDYMVRHEEVDRRGTKYVFLDSAGLDVGTLFTKEEFPERYEANKFKKKEEK